jgi:epoxyqueuosine reductase
MLRQSPRGVSVFAGTAISDELRTFLKSHGADAVGFADLQDIAPDIRDNFPFGISIAVALNPQIVSGIKDGPTKQYHAEYERVNHLLNSLGHHAVQFLEKQGFKAGWFAATDAGIDPETLSTRLPHKTVATRAGLGWIGKCALLVTETFGSAIRITSVLTEANLPAGDAIDTSQCGDCRACVDVCPAHASSGRDWQVNLRRDSFFDAFACRKAAHEMEMRNIGTEVNICGMCIAACPWTQRYIKKAG